MVCGLHCRHSWGVENVKGTQRNNETDWHKDCNRTQQHHWHSVCFQPKRRGEASNIQKAFQKVFVQSSIANSSSDWAPSDSKMLLRYTSLICRKEELSVHLLKSQSQDCGSSWTGKCRASWAVKKGSSKQGSEQMKEKVEGSQVSKTNKNRRGSRSQKRQVTSQPG